MRKQVTDYIRLCHVCQAVGNPNQVIPQVPLNPIPVPSEPFAKVVINCVGLLPKTKKGNKYLLTIMDPTTRYPEAIPLKNTLAKNIVKHLLHFFTFVGLPQEIQSDRSTNFTSNLFKQVVQELCVHHILSSAYRPQSQGCLERLHQTIKSMLKKFCLESQRDWDEKIDWLLFAIRESPQESTGYSPFELLFGRTIRGPLEVLQDKMLQPTPIPNVTVAKYIDNLRNTLIAVRTLSSENLGKARILAHDIQLTDPNLKPIKQAPYRLSPYKAKIMEKEVQYLLDNKLPNIVFLHGLLLVFWYLRLTVLNGFAQTSGRSIASQSWTLSPYL